MIPSEWEKGWCVDEIGMDQTVKELEAPKTMSPEECLNWCNKQKFATGCEYLNKWQTCKAHTWSVYAGSGDEGFLCAVILPKGLIFISIKQSNFFDIHQELIVQL